LEEEEDSREARKASDMKSSSSEDMAKRREEEEMERKVEGREVQVFEGRGFERGRDAVSKDEKIRVREGKRCWLRGKKEGSKVSSRISDVDF